MNILITGGAGFIGSALIRYLLNETEHTVLNIDKLTYAGNLAALSAVDFSQNYQFKQIDICDEQAIRQTFHAFQPDAVFHLAAESHVDRSINGAAPFVQTNIVGTYTLLEVTHHYWQRLPQSKQSSFRFIHVSTDEVYGDLSPEAPLFTEQTAYAPSSPYSASKAASDHLVRAWYRTYGLPAIVTHCTNNYGAYQYPEKFIPLMILNALQGKSLPIYGDGLQIRDWLCVDDHVRALYCVLMKGKVGETYNIGANNEITNLQLVGMICEQLEQLAPIKPPGVQRYADLITFVPDRAGHDRRYAIDTTKIQHELGWQPQQHFAAGLRQTILWYLNTNRDSC